MTDIAEQLLPTTEIYETAEDRKVQEVSALEDMLSGIPAVVDLYDHVQDLKQTDSPVKEIIGRESQRRSGDTMKEIASSGVDKDFRYAIGVLGREELGRRFNSIIANQYPSHLHEVATTCASALVSNPNSSAENIGAERQAAEVKREREPKLVDAVIDNLYPFIDTTITPQNACNIISLFALSSKNRREESPHIDIVAQALALTITRPEHQSLRDYITSPPQELLDEISQQQLEVAYYDGDKLIGEQIAFISKLIDKSEDNVMQLILDTDLANLPGSILSILKSRVNDLLYNSNLNLSGVLDRLNNKDTEVSQDFLERLLARSILTGVRATEKGYSGVKPTGGAMLSLQPKLRQLVTYLKGTRTNKRKVSNPGTTTQIEQCSDDNPEQESLKELVPARIEKGIMKETDETIITMVDAFAACFRSDPNAHEIITAIINKLQTLDFSGDTVPGVKKVSSATGKLKDEYGKPVTLFELKPKELVDISTKGPLANTIRVFFALKGKDKIIIAGLVRRREMSKWLRNRGLPSAN